MDFNDNIKQVVLFSPIEANLAEPHSVFARVECTGHSHDTSVVNATAAPSWHEEFSFPVTDPSGQLVVSVHARKSTLLGRSSRFLGQARLSLYEMIEDDGGSTGGGSNSDIDRWEPLCDEEWEDTTAQIHFTARVVHDKVLFDKLQSQGGGSGRHRRQHEASGGVDDTDEADPEDNAPETSHQHKLRLLELQQIRELRRQGQISQAGGMRPDGGTEEESGGLSAGRPEPDLEVGQSLARQSRLPALPCAEEGTGAIPSPGEFQVIVHVIEGLELHGEDASHLSDPMVTAEFFTGDKNMNKGAHKLSTKHCSQCKECVWDEMLFFDVGHLDHIALAASEIRVSCFDHNSVLSNSLIGSCAFSLREVYAMKGHEMYRKWCAISDMQNAADVGVQGYLRLSITVLGTNDKALVHDVTAEQEAELELSLDNVLDSTAETGDSEQRSACDALVVRPPALDMELRFLVVTVHKAEDLPQMDVTGGIDVVVQVNFAGSPACKTRPITVKPPGPLNCTIEQQLWVPFLHPTHARQVAISVWDRDLVGADDIVAYSWQDWSRVQDLASAAEAAHDAPDATNSSSSSDDGEGLDDEGEVPATQFWVTLFGAPRRCSDRGFARRMNRYGATEGSAYRGRVLLSMRAVSGYDVDEEECVHVKQLRTGFNERFAPKTLRYTLRAMLVEGLDLPEFRTGIGTSSKMLVRVSVGMTALEFEPRPNARGRVVWHDMQQADGIELPQDLTQVPDILVHLCRTTATGISEPVCFARVCAAELYHERFKTRPRWIMLREDKTRHKTFSSLDPERFPGTLLLKLGFGREEWGEHHRWHPPPFFALRSDSLRPVRSANIHACNTSMSARYQVRVHVYQAKNLPAADKMGTVDPYVVVRFKDQHKTTRREKRTCNPMFYQCVTFETELHDDLDFAPEVSISVFDKDKLTPDNLLGRCRLSLAEGSEGSSVGKISGRAQNSGHKVLRMLAREVLRPEEISKTRRQEIAAHRPHWEDLCVKDPGDCEGRVLVKVELVKLDASDHVPMPPAEEVPPSSPAFLEIVCFGLRSMKPYMKLMGHQFDRFVNVREPHLMFEAGNWMPPPPKKSMFQLSGNVWRTKSSSTPSGANANFLEHLVIPMKLPDDPIFMPELQIKAFDNRLGSHPIIGTTSVPLAPLVPWVKGYSARAPPSLSSDPLEAGVTSGKRADDMDAAPNSGRFGNSDLGIGAFPSDGRFLGVPLHEDERDFSWLQDPAFGGDIKAVRRRGRGRKTDTRARKLRKGRKKERNADDAEQRDGEDLKNFYSHEEFSLSSLDGRWENPLYLEGSPQKRDWYLQGGGGELESMLQPAAFTNFPLYRGQRRGRFGRLSIMGREVYGYRSTHRQVGVFKGLIRVTNSDPRLDPVPFVDTEVLKKRKKIKAVVNIICATNLQPRHQRTKYLHRHTTCDPYLKVKIEGTGKRFQSTNKRAHHSTTNPQFFERFEIPVHIPGMSKLRISVFDRNKVGKDDFIGSSTIDLEERWFNPKWQALGCDDRWAAKRGPLKPLEIRDLNDPTTGFSRGQLQMWLDLIPMSDVKALQPVQLKPAAELKGEVRLIFYRAQDVRNMNGRLETMDLYLRTWIGNSKIVKRTDTHFRCSTGKPVWNYRIKLPVTLPLEPRELARLHVQLWDKNLLANEAIASTQLDLYPWLQLLYKRKMEVAPLRELKAIRSSNNSSKFSDYGSDDEDTKRSMSDSSSSEDEHKDTDADAISESTTLLKRVKVIPSDSRRGRRQFGSGNASAFSVETRAEREKRMKTMQEDSEAKEAVDSLKEMLGVGFEPPEADWLNLHVHEKSSGQSPSVGRLLLAITMVTEDEAKEAKVGEGRRSPNENPYLPPPAGRLKLNVNPFALIRQIMNSRYFWMVLCCCTCVLFMSFAAIYGNFFINLYTVMHGK